MKLEIQAFGGIKVIEEIPDDATSDRIKIIVEDALANALIVRDAYVEFVHENETDEEREMREFQQEQQELAIRNARAQNARALTMLAEADGQAPNRAARRRAR